MLRPKRHMNLDICVLNLSAYIICVLMQKGEVGYTDLAKMTVKKFSKRNSDYIAGIEENFPYAINFLFLMGKINYRKCTDSFIYEAK